MTLRSDANSMRVCSRIDPLRWACSSILGRDLVKEWSCWLMIVDDGEVFELLLLVMMNYVVSSIRMTIIIIYC